MPDERIYRAGLPVGCVERFNMAKMMPAVRDDELRKSKTTYMLTAKHLAKPGPVVRMDGVAARRCMLSREDGISDSPPGP